MESAAHEFYPLMKNEEVDKLRARVNEAHNNQSG